MDFEIFFITEWLLILFSTIYLFFRNNWVSKVITKAIGTPLYEELISYDEMMTKKIFTFDINKLKT